METSQGNLSPEMKKFLGTDFSWVFTAGECNFLIQLLAYIAQANPSFVPSQKGEKESLNYQSLRSIILLNEKLSAQLQHRAKDASVILSNIEGTETVQ